MDEPEDELKPRSPREVAERCVALLAVIDRALNGSPRNLPAREYFADLPTQESFESASTLCRLVSSRVRIGLAAVTPQGQISILL